MNRVLHLFALLAPCIATACVASEPRLQNRNVAVVFAAPPTLEQQAADAERASQPRAEHHALDPLAGSWSTSLVSVSPEGAESDPHPGSAQIRLVLGGRYLDWDATLEIGGVVHETTGFLGFDLNDGEYENLMISDLATGMSVAHGRGDIAGAGIKLVLEVADPSSGAIKRAQSTLRLVDKDHFVLEQLGIDAQGNERIVRRTHYRRANVAARS